MRRAAMAMGALTVVAIVVVVRTIPRRMAPVSSSAVVEHIVFIAFAICVGILAAGVGWIATRRGGASIAAASTAVGLSVVTGAARFPRVPQWLTALVNLCWLGSATAGTAVLVLTISGQSGGLRRSQHLTLGAVLVTAVSAAVIDRGIGLRSTLGPLSTSPVPGFADVALAVHCTVLAIGGLWLLLDADRAQRKTPISGRRSIVVVGLVWLATVIAERIVPLMPIDTFRDVERGVYQPWAFLVGAKLPMLGYIGLLIAVGWALVTMPVRSVQGQPLRLRDIDPFETLRQDMAAWLGDPTIELAFADDDGNWRSPSGVVRLDNRAYDRRTTVLTRDGRAVAALFHDVDMARSPETMATAAALAGLALDANRLIAASEARLAQAHELSGRLLRADASTRDEVLEELEAGPLARLRRAADGLRRGESVADLVDELRLAASEVRVLSHGTYPPELVEGGVRAALPGVRGVPDRRLPRSIELTAFLLAIDAHVAEFDDRGDVLRIHRKGPPLGRGISDRLAVLGASVVEDVIELPTNGTIEVNP